MHHYIFFKGVLLCFFTELICNIDELPFWEGRGNTEIVSNLFTNHNALGQPTNHNIFRSSEGGPSSNPELILPFVSGRGERY